MIRPLYKTYAAKESFGMAISFILCRPHSEDSDIKFLPQEFGIGAQSMEWSDDLASNTEAKKHQGPCCCSLRAPGLRGQTPKGCLGSIVPCICALLLFWLLCFDPASDYEDGWKWWKGDDASEEYVIDKYQNSASHPNGHKPSKWQELVHLRFSEFEARSCWSIGSSILGARSATAWTGNGPYTTWAVLCCDSLQALHLARAQKCHVAICIKL